MSSFRRILHGERGPEADADADPARFVPVSSAFSAAFFVRGAMQPKPAAEQRRLGWWWFHWESRANGIAREAHDQLPGSVPNGWVTRDPERDSGVCQGTETVRGSTPPRGLVGKVGPCVMLRPPHTGSARFVREAQPGD
jgi:hypothetical protein